MVMSLVIGVAVGRQLAVPAVEIETMSLFLAEKLVNYLNVNVTIHANLTFSNLTN